MTAPVLAQAFLNTFSLALKEQGQSVIVRSLNQETGSMPLINPFTITGTTVNGAVLAGVASINFGVTGLSATGFLKSGDQFTVAGNTTVYTISANTDPKADNSGFTAIPFAPPLAQNAANGAAVAIAFSSDVTLNAIVTTYSMVSLPGSAIQAGDRRVSVRADLLPFTPKPNDTVFISGVPYQVSAVMPRTIQGYIVSYAMVVRR